MSIHRMTDKQYKRFEKETFDIDDEMDTDYPY